MPGLAAGPCPALPGIGACPRPRRRRASNPAGGSLYEPAHPLAAGRRSRDSVVTRLDIDGGKDAKPEGCERFYTWPGAAGSWCTPGGACVPPRVAPPHREQTVKAPRHQELLGANSPSYVAPHLVISAEKIKVPTRMVEKRRYE